jgi:NADPH:quinone reductase
MVADWGSFAMAHGPRWWQCQHRRCADCRTVFRSTTAALTNVGVTAYGGLRTAELKAGETLVVLGASGGVGSAAIQIGKAIGCRVIAIVSTAGKAERLQALGADHVLALADGPLGEQVQDLTEGTGADVVLDTIGGDVTGQALSSLAPFGRLVHVGYSAGTSLKIDSLDLISKPSTILGFNIFLVPTERSAKDIDEVIALAAKKKYRAVIDKTFPMSEVAEATRYLDERKAVGKVVLTF